jgi:hypothetical protein
VGGLTYTQAQAAAATNVGERSVERYADIRKHGTEELKDEVDRERISLRAGAAIAKLEPEQQIAKVEQNRIERAKPKRNRRPPEEIAAEKAEKGKRQAEKQKDKEGAEQRKAERANQKYEILNILATDLRPARLHRVLQNLERLSITPCSDIVAMAYDKFPDLCDDDGNLIEPAPEQAADTAPTHPPPAPAPLSKDKAAA